LSFPRKRESSCLNMLWTPAFAGVTGFLTFYEVVRFDGVLFVKFIADQNLGRLVKWLRIMGYDTVLYRGPADRSFLRKAEKEGRTVLTRRRDMAGRQFAGTLIVVKHDRLEDQLATLMEALPIHPEPARLFTLCLRCNRSLKEVDKEEVSGQVPAYVLETQSRFRVCPQCRGIFWPGTHRENIRRFLGMSSPDHSL